MPNTKSAIRRVRRVKKQTQINRIRKSKYKNAIKQMEMLLKSKETEKAKNFFSLAIENITENSSLTKLIQIKLDDLS